MTQERDIKAAILRQGLFDPGFYLDHALSSGIGRLANHPSLLDHYLTIGADHGLDPSAQFSTTAYMRANPDVAASGMGALAHYAMHGQAQSRPRGTEADELNARAIAFYLPQFHPDPQNDAWWGKGFTEWSNVTRARPFFARHVQPILPGELGFYDLRVPEIRTEQARLAASHGIDAFCYYHYWFNGRTLLGRPLADLIASGQPDFPFCLCWANENWTRAWDGRDQEVLLRQEHDPLSDYGYIHDILPILADSRYLRVEGKPLLLVYRPDLLSEPLATTNLWREVALQAGLNGLHLGAVDYTVRTARPLGFDCVVGFPPHHFPADDISAAAREDLGAPGEMLVRSYAAGVARAIAQPDRADDEERIPTVMPSWDNTARRMERALVYYDADPTLFRLWTTAELLRASRVLPHGRRMLFINAWNEWAEGAVMEPRRDLGTAYLQAFAAARMAVEARVGAGRDDAYIELLAWLHAIDACRSRGRMPHIVVAGTDSTPILADLLHAMRARFDIDIFVILPEADTISGRYGAAEHILNAWRFIPDLTPSATAALIMAMLPPRAGSPILCHGTTAGIFAAAAAQHGLRCVAQLNEPPPDTALFAGVERITTASAFAQAALVTAAPHLADRIHVIPTRLPEPATPPDRDRQRAALGIGPDDHLVLACGDIGLANGADLIPGLAALVEAALPGVWFAWHGAGTDPTLLAWIEHDVRLRALRQVRFISPTDPAPYAAADIVIHPARRAADPGDVLAASLHGVPVIAFRGAGGAMDVLEGLPGLLVPYGDTQAMAAQIVTLLHDPAGRRTLGAALREGVTGARGWNAFVLRFYHAWTDGERLSVDNTAVS